MGRNQASASLISIPDQCMGSTHVSCRTYGSLGCNREAAIFGTCGTIDSRRRSPWLPLAVLNGNSARRVRVDGSKAPSHDQRIARRLFGGAQQGSGGSDTARTFPTGTGAVDERGRESAEVTGQDQAAALPLRGVSPAAETSRCGRSPNCTLRSDSTKGAK